MLANYRVFRYDKLESPAVTAGDAAVLIGAQNGRFPDLGYTIPGEMGGLWAGERKVCDGFFFAIDDVPLEDADCCEMHPLSTSFHYRMLKEGLHVVRRQVIPDGVAGCMIELTIENLRDMPRIAEVSFTVRTEVLTVAAARGEDGLELGRDVAEYDEKTQAFYARDSRNPWHVVWGAEEKYRVLHADLPQQVYGFGNSLGKGVNGRLFYRLRLPANGQVQMRLFVLGGYPSRSRAEGAIISLRANAAQCIAEKEARMIAMMGESDATLPNAQLERCFNWAKIHSDYLTRRLPRGGSALCVDLPEHMTLFGEGFAAALGALLPTGGAKKVQEMLRTLVRLSEEAQLAPGRLARSVTLGGKVISAGSAKESAQFVDLVYRVLQWTGDKAFAMDMLSTTGLCVNYLRRFTRSFEDIQPDIRLDLRRALEAQAYILRIAGSDDSLIAAALEKLPREELPQTLDKEATLEAQAIWHARLDHVEQMVGCLKRMATLGAPGLPGALRSAGDEPGAILTARAAASFVWPMMVGLFGVAPDAGEKRIDFAPHVPIGWDGWALDNLAVGEAKLSIRAERISPSRAKYSLSIDCDGFTLCAGGAEHALKAGEALTLEMGD
ncbi:MAG: hypothetical protein IKU34_10650 [Clostridia bacterium]|nr:hypothetical protein [Clostridia bacterium]